MSDSQQGTCATCVHGHDLDITADSLVVCTPQHKAHSQAYGCTGYRKVTPEELDERSVARFGKPTKCCWVQKPGGVWSASCGIKMAWLMDACPNCKRKVDAMKMKEKGE